MQLANKLRGVSAFATIMVVACLLLPRAAWPALVYKNYIVQQNDGVDILCAPYTVQVGDWVIKILKLRGEIAATDFPYFLQIFARINPQVKDVNRIRPGQQIFIPLREMPPGSFQDQHSGLVTIPFVDLSSKSAVSLETAPAYRVRPGDTISKLMSRRYGRYGSSAYQEGVKQLTALNPKITDLDLIFVDQVIFLPTAGAQPGQAEILSTAPVTTRPIAQAQRQPQKDAGFSPGGGSAQGRPAASEISPLSEAAALMEAGLTDKGTYIFPSERKGAVRLDLSQTPVIDLPDGQKVLLSGKKPIEDADLNAVTAQWKNFRQLSLPANASLEQVLEAVLDAPEKGAARKKTVQLTAGGVIFDIRPKWLLNGPDSETNPIRHICITPIDSSDQRTPSEIIRFLARHGIRIREVIRSKAIAAAPASPPQAPPAKTATVYVKAEGHRSFVADLLQAMGYTFTRNVAISFPYAGIEVKAMSNLVTTRSGNPLFIDFGDLFGDAFKAISDTGFNIIQVTAQDDTRTVIDKLLTALDEPISLQPTFLAAKRPERYNTRINIPGHLVGNETAPRTLITSIRMADPIERLLNDQRVRVVIVQRSVDQPPPITLQSVPQAAYQHTPAMNEKSGKSGSGKEIVNHEEVSRP